MKFSVLLATFLLGSRQCAVTASLPRCPSTDASGGSDLWQVARVGAHCASLLRSAYFRTIGGNLMTYSAEVTDGSTCDAKYEKAVDMFMTLSSGTCRSYFVSPGIACLSSCADDYDCYVSENAQAISAGSCAAAAGVEEDVSDSESNEDGGGNVKDKSGSFCYDYKYIKGPNWREDPPEEKKCRSSCVSYEFESGDTTYSTGGCDSGISNFCEVMKVKDDSMRNCIQCSGGLCNPVYSYNGSSFVGMKLAYFGVALTALAFAW